MTAKRKGRKKSPRRKAPKKVAKGQSMMMPGMGKMPGSMKRGM